MENLNVSIGLYIIRVTYWHYKTKPDNWVALFNVKMIFFKFISFLVKTKLFGIWKDANITNHQGNGSKKQNEILPHTSTNSYYQKKKKKRSHKKTRVGKYMEKPEPSYIVGGN